MKNDPEKTKHLVCAIYTRKSTSEGLDQDFTSLDNQRESAENYIKSQQHEGWIASSELYDDGGFTGANIERPALQKLLNDIKEGKINCVVVYKVDRLSRSLLDFSQLLEFFDKNNVVFVSITQQFNTNTSMGRLTLNILLSFAQFEREIISERTRDKLGAARKRGQWLGGRPPFGYMYDPKEKCKIIINPETADIVKKVFSLYLEKNSALEVSQAMNEAGYRTSTWTTKSGKPVGNKKYSLSRVTYMLHNQAYIGKANYKGQIYPGLWPAIIDEETWTKAHNRLDAHRTERKPYRTTGCSGLLSKVLKCKTCGSAMVHTYVIKKGRHKYRYYYCSNAQKRGKAECAIRYVGAQALEERVEQLLRGAIKITPNMPNKAEAEAILSPIWNTIFFEEKRRILRALIQDGDFDTKTNMIGLTLTGSTERLEFDSAIKKTHAPTRDGKERRLAKEPAIRKTLLLAHQLSRHLALGKIKDLNQASMWLGINQSRLNHVLGLLNLSPSIQTEIITAEPQYLSNIPEYKLRDLSAEIDWNSQSSIWQKIKQAHA
ncbi:MAG: recombinase family protein [Candidatus Omnitrophica bacterium]|nr:recombinase family protein [Candidatus Omnitrophota bacterium]